MNHIIPTVTAIESMDNLTIVAFETEARPIGMMAFGSNVPISVGSTVVPDAKASNIAMDKDLKNMISTSNRRPYCRTDQSKYTLYCGGEYMRRYIKKDVL